MSVGDTKNRQDKSWLVKSSTRILGPYCIDDIAQLLLKKHISIIDEVRPPIGRWKYIREHRIFDEVVHALRAEQESAGEFTQTSTQTHTPSSSHTALTKTDTVRLFDELTPTPEPLVRSDLGSPFDKEGVKDIVPVRETNIPLSSAKQRSSGVSYGHASDRRMQDEVNRSKKWMRLGFALVAVAVVAATLVFQTRKNIKREQGYEALIEEALRDRSLQLYERSLIAYRKAALIKEPDADTQSQMALVLIALDRQNVLGRRILEKEVQNENNSRPRMIDAWLGIAISYVMDGSLKEAEDSLQKILILEPGNFNARLNLALIALRKGDWPEATKQLEDLSRRHPPHPLVLLARAIALLESGASREGVQVHGLNQEIRQLLDRSSQLRHELLLVQTALTSADNPNFETSLSQFLGEIAQQENLYIRDLRLDWRVAEWESLDKQCRELASRVSGSARVKALRAVCLAEAGRDNEGRRFLDEALNQGRKDALILFTQANLFYRNGLRNEAYAVLRLPELSGLPIRETLTGRICLDQGDLSCAEKSFRQVLAKQGSDLVATAGLADVLLRQDKQEEAATLIRDGLDREPSYLPLIELREVREAGH